VCLSNLHQWGLVFGLYGGDHTGKFSTWPTDYSTGWWMKVLEEYYQADAMRLCPTAQEDLGRVGATVPDAYGGATRTWGPVWDGTSGSYGINHYLYGYVPNIWTQDSNQRFFWGRLDPDKGQVPLLADCTWPGSFPSMSDRVPPSGDDAVQRWGLGIDEEMSRYSLNRHGGAINSSFTDLSARRVELPELWQLNWHARWVPQVKSRQDFVDQRGNIWLK